MNIGWNGICLKRVKQDLSTEHCRTVGVREQKRHDGLPSKDGNALSAGEPCLCLRYLTGGTISQKTSKKSYNPKAARSNMKF